MKMLSAIILVLSWMTDPTFAEPMTEPLAAALIKVKAGEAVIVDVREAEEIKEGMIDQAIWLPTSEIKAKSPRYEEIMKALPKDKPIYTYCAAGVRSEAFSDALDEQGYTAANLGGYPELIVAGFTSKAVPEAKSQACPYLCGNLKAPAPAPPAAEKKRK